MFGGHSCPETGSRQHASPQLSPVGSRPGTVGRPQTCGVSLGAVSVATPRRALLTGEGTARTPNNTRSQNPHWVRSRGLCLAQHTKATVSNSARRSPQTDSLVVVPPPHETLTLPRPHPHTSSVVVLRMRVTTSVRIRARRVSTCRHPHASATAASLGYHPPAIWGRGHRPRTLARRHPLSGRANSAGMLERTWSRLHCY